MGKRKVQEDNDSDIDVSSTDSETELEVQPQGEQGVGAEEEEETVDVDFDYFDLNPSVDFHATKTFLTQLFGDDANSFDISALADLILQENSVGTTIKTDGKESDPFAILSVINLNENLTKPCIKQLCDYIFKKTAANSEFNIILKKLLSKSKTTSNTSQKELRVGLIVSERMINMPVEVVPPMYKMLLEEMSKDEDANQRHEFDYFLVISKIYHLVAANEVSEEEELKSKSKKNKKSQTKQVEMDYFHYEDIVLEANSSYKGVYNYTNQNQETDSRRVFTEYGIDPKLSLILLDRESLEKSVPEMEQKFPPF